MSSLPLVFVGAVLLGSTFPQKPFFILGRWGIAPSSSVVRSWRVHSHSSFLLVNCLCIFCSKWRSNYVGLGGTSCIFYSSFCSIHEVSEFFFYVNSLLVNVPLSILAVSWINVMFVLCMVSLYNALDYVTFVAIPRESSSSKVSACHVEVAYKMHILASIRSLRWKLTSVTLKILSKIAHTRKYGMTW